jgi:hypothetical protein
MTIRPLALALAAALAMPVAAQAGDPVAGPKGLPCRLVPYGVQPAAGQGFTVGGPYDARGTLTCTVGTDAVSFTSGGPVSFVPPTAVTYAPSGFPVATVRVCTSFTPPGGPTVYLHQTSVGDLVGHWTTDPFTCGFGVDPLAPVPVTDPVALANYVIALVLLPFQPCFCDPWADPVICGYFQALYPGLPPVVEIRPDGDVYLNGEFFWDCPPYDVE